MLDATCRDDGPSLRPAGLRRGVLAALCVAALALLSACAPTQTQDGPTTGPGQGEPAAPEALPPEVSAEEVLQDAITAPDEFRLTPPGDPDLPPYRVGLLLPLSGPRASLGEAMLEAAQMALFDIADDAFSLIVRDTKGTPEGAKRAAQDAIAGGANLLLGPVFASSVEAVAPVAEGGMVPVVAFSNSRSVARPDVFVTGLLPGEQVDRIVSYAAGEGHERFAVLAPNNDYGDLIAEAMREAADRHGVSVADTAFFEPGAQDISAPVRQLADYQRRQQELKRRLAELRSRGTASARREAERLKAQDALGSAPFDAVLLPIGGSRLRQLAPTLPYYDIDPDEVQFLGTTQWYGAPLTGDPSLRGAWFPAPPREGLGRFERRYEETYGAPPRPAPLAALAYDTTALAALLARRAGESDTPPWRVYTQESLTRRTGFAGVTGIFRLNPDGLVQRRYAIMEVTDQGVQTRDPAPGTFTDVPTN